MFSCETQIHAILSDSAKLGVHLLLLTAVLKVLLLALSFKSGYLGGPIFPTLFTCTMIGLALSLLFPGVPASIFVMCIEVAVITMALGIPLTAILLVAVVGAGNTNTIALLVVSAVVALIVGIGLRELRKRKGAENAVVPRVKKLQTPD